MTAIQLRGDELAIPVVTHHVLEQRRRGAVLRGPGGAVRPLRCGVHPHLLLDRGRVAAALARPGVATTGDRRGARRHPRPLRFEHPRHPRGRAPRGDDRRLRPDGAAADRHHGRDRRLPVAEPGHDLLGQGRTPRRCGRRRSRTLDEITLAFEGDPDPIALVVREDGDIHGIITGATSARRSHMATAVSPPARSARPRSARCSRIRRCSKRSISSPRSAARPYAPRSGRPRHHHRRGRLRRRATRHLRGPPVTGCP